MEWEETFDGEGEQTVWVEPVGDDKTKRVGYLVEEEELGLVMM